MGHGNGSCGWRGGNCIQQPPVCTESRFSCAPAAPAALSQRALFILLNPVNERCRMKSPDSQYLPVTQQLLHGQCLAEQLPPLSPCHVWQPAVLPSALRGWVQRAKCCACCCAWSFMAIYGPWSLRFLQGTVFSVTG